MPTMSCRPTMHMSSCQRDKGGPVLHTQATAHEESASTSYLQNRVPGCNYTERHGTIAACGPSNIFTTQSHQTRTGRSAKAVVARCYECWVDLPFLCRKAKHLGQKTLKDLGEPHWPIGSANQNKTKVVRKFQMRPYSVSVPACRRKGLNTAARCSAANPQFAAQATAHWELLEGPGSNPWRSVRPKRPAGLSGGKRSAPLAGKGSRAGAPSDAHGNSQIDSRRTSSDQAHHCNCIRNTQKRKKEQPCHALPLQPTGPPRQPGSSCVKLVSHRASTVESSNSSTCQTRKLRQPPAVGFLQCHGTSTNC